MRLTRNRHMVDIPITKDKREREREKVTPHKPETLRYPSVSRRQSIPSSIGCAVTLEKRVRQSLFRRNAARRIVLKHGVQQRDAVRLELRDELSSVLPFPFGERRLEVGE